VDIFLVFHNRNKAESVFTILNISLQISEKLAKKSGGLPYMDLLAV
jgi:hypothetical protein